MFGDDRPDHGVAKMRMGKEYFKDALWFLMALVKRAEIRMEGDIRDKACDAFWQWHRAKTESEKEFIERIQQTNELRQTRITGTN